MPSINYTISYDKQIQMLAFKYEVLPNDDYSRPFKMLFNDVISNVIDIMLDSHNLKVCGVSVGGCGGILYVDYIPYNEHITDILFLQGKYSDYKNHYPALLSQEQFTLWQNAIKDVDKPAILRMLYQYNKISRAYLLKHSNHPVSLYELGKYNLIDNFFGKAANQAKKIDELTLPLSIKEDLKHSCLK